VTGVLSGLFDNGPTSGMSPSVYLRRKEDSEPLDHAVRNQHNVPTSTQPNQVASCPEGPDGGGCDR
jgi:hypothetical protein